VKFGAEQHGETGVPEMSSAAEQTLGPGTNLKRAIPTSV
jgi:hypothetical protein